MTLKEKRQQRKASMSSFRWKILTVGIPLYVLILLFPAPIILGLLAAGNDAGIIGAAFLGIEEILGRGLCCSRPSFTRRYKQSIEKQTNSLIIVSISPKGISPKLSLCWMTASCENAMK